MKKALFAFILFSVFSCTKEDPAPILSEVLQGTFNATIVKISGLPLSVPFTNPANGQTLSGKVTTTKKTDTSVGAIVTIVIKDAKGTQEIPNDQGEYTLNGDGKTTINIMKDGAQVGTYDVASKTLNIKSKVPNPLDGNKITDAEITGVKM